jgi:phage recombination protein Bet
MTIRTIESLRAIAARSGAYAGCDEVVFGPDRTETLGGVEVTFPAWAQITVYRMVDGQRAAFPGPRVLWLETYQTAAPNTEEPEDWWRKRPYGQIEKCAEAAALRRAFAEEVGSDYVHEEMDGRAPFVSRRQDAEPRKLSAGFKPADLGLKTGAQLLAEQSTGAGE